jgi:hypothetical protein
LLLAAGCWLLLLLLLLLLCWADVQRSACGAAHLSLLFKFTNSRLSLLPAPPIK